MPPTNAPAASLNLNDRWWATCLVLIYFVSGLTGVAYEVLWVRMLSLQFGVSIFGVVITLAAFMAGLGAGSLIGARLSQRFSRPLLLLAGLECAVALFAIALPEIFKSLDAGLGVLAINWSLTQWHGLQAVMAFCVLLLPAMALGAGFPLILQALSTTPVTLARVYGLNTLGGATGALLPLALLPLLGLSLSIYIIAFLGFSVAIAFGLLACKQPQIQGVDKVSRPRPALKILLLYAGIGAAALMLELGWARLYGMILLRTEYVLAIILAVFLVGIGLGSLLARKGSTSRWLPRLPLLAGGCALLSLWGLPLLAAWVDVSNFTSLFSALWAQGLALALLTLPVTLVLGAWLPLLSRWVAEEGHAAGAWLYGANSIGAAGGILLAGFVLLPWLGTATTVCVAALSLFGCGLIWVNNRQAVLVGLLLLLVAIPVMKLPEVNSLLPTNYASSSDLDMYEDALSITHVVEQQDGQRLLLADLQRVDASSDPNAVVVQMNQARLPLLLHPEPRSVLLLGLGTGISAAGALLFPDLSVTAVELSRGAIAAARQWFAPVNNEVMKKINVVQDDARRFLRADSSSYDVIIGDLFHPDLVGRSNLLSVQQFQRAKNRLAPEGLFVQWLALNQFDASSLDVIMRSFRRVFPNAVFFVDGFRVALVGPRDQFLGAPAMLSNLSRITGSGQNAATGGEGPWTWLGRYWGRVPQSSGPVQDEWAPLIEFKLPQARYHRDIDLVTILQRVLLEQRPTVEQAILALGVPAESRPAFERGYIATELAMRGWLATLTDRAEEAHRLMRLAYEANNKDRWAGFYLADNMLASLPQAIKFGRDERTALKSILAVRPDHIETLRILWRLELQQGNDKQGNDYRERIRQLSPLDSEVR